MFIVASDLHISESKPAYRLEENWLQVCLGKFSQLLDYAKVNSCPIVIAGDFFDKSSHSPEVVNSVNDLIIKSQVEIIIVPGNHDIRNHNLQLLDKSSVYTLGYSGARIIANPEQIIIDEMKIDLFPFGTELSDMGGDIAIIHEFTYKQKPWPGCSPAGNYRRVMKRLGGRYQLVIAGDNHEDFIANWNDSKLLNCGGMLRMARDEQDRSPAYYLIDNDLKIKPQLYKIEKQVFDLNAIELVARKDEAIERVAEQMKSKMTIELNFKKNIKKRIDQGDIESEVVEIIKEVAL